MRFWAVLALMFVSACSQAVQDPLPEAEPPTQRQILKRLVPIIPENQIIPPITDTINLSSIQKLTCDTGTGTGEIVSSDFVVTAYHVVGQSKTCLIGDRPFEVVYRSEELDFAVLDYSPREHDQRIPINCDGFVTGQKYYMVGWARGYRYTLNIGTATATYVNGKDFRSGQPFTDIRELDGRVYPGMSGGAVLDQRGYLVGIVNATSTVPGKAPTMLARELRQTYMCEPRT